MKIGMVAEATCVSKPWTIIPMVVTGVQDYIAAGQFRGGEQLIDAQQVTRPGTILVFLEPLYAGGLDGVTPGSSCIANAYSSNHELLIASPDIGTAKRLVLHAVDAVGLVHALLLRIQALVLPIQSLVFAGIRTRVRTAPHEPRHRTPLSRPLGPSTHPPQRPRSLPSSARRSVGTKLRPHAASTRPNRISIIEWRGLHEFGPGSQAGANSFARNLRRVASDQANEAGQRRT